MHGDAHLNNVLLRRDRPELAAFIDWEMCTIGDPLIGLAITLVILRITWQSWRTVSTTEPGEMHDPTEAPPEEETDTSGSPSAAAWSQARANFSPTTLPIEPPMNAKSITASTIGRPSSSAEPTTIASSSPVAARSRSLAASAKG